MPGAQGARTPGGELGATQFSGAKPCSEMLARNDEAVVAKCSEGVGMREAVMVSLNKRNCRMKARAKDE